MDVFRFRWHATLTRKDTQAIQREKVQQYGTSCRQRALFDLFQTVNVAFAYSTAMLNVMSGAYGPFFVFTREISSACGRQTVAFSKLLFKLSF